MMKDWRVASRRILSRGKNHTWLGLILLLLGWTMTAGCQAPPPALDPAKTYNEAYLSLRRATVDPDARVRAKAMEAFPNVLGSAAGPLLLEGLRDPMSPVRFSASMGVGDLRYAPAHSLLVAMAKDPQIPAKLQCAIIYALHRLGDDAYTGQLGFLLYDKDKWVRCSAAMVLGKMGEPSAIEPLKSLRWEDHDPVVQLQVYEALAQLGDERSISLLEAFTKSQFLEDRIIAIQTLGRIGNQRSTYPLSKLMEDNKQEPLVRVAAAGALARMHDKSGFKLAMAAVSDPAKVLREGRPKNSAVSQQDTSNLQSMAALALGNMDNRDALPSLVPLVRSPNGTVRVAACEAVMQLLASYQLSLPAIEPERIPTTFPGETLPPPVECPPAGPTTMPSAVPSETPAETPAATSPSPEVPAAPAPSEETPVIPAPAPVPAPAAPAAVPAAPAPAAAEQQPAAEAAPGEQPAASEPTSQPSEQNTIEELLKSKAPPRLKRAGARD